MRINNSVSDQERLAQAQYKDSDFIETVPHKKPEHLSWNLRPRIENKELGGPAFLTSS